MHLALPNRQLALGTLIVKSQHEQLTSGYQSTAHEWRYVENGFSMMVQDATLIGVPQTQSLLLRHFLPIFLGGYDLAYQQSASGKSC